MPNASAQNDAHVAPEHQAAVGRQLNRQRSGGGSSSLGAAPSLSEFGKKPGSDKMSPMKTAQDVAKVAKVAAEAGAGNVVPAAITAAKWIREIMKQVQLGTDWPYLFLLLPMVILKDIFDIAFAATGPVGIVVSFVGAVNLSIFTAVCLILIGGGLKSRNAARLIIGPIAELLTESIPAINWGPCGTAEVLILYVWVLMDRAMQAPRPAQETAPA